MLGKFWARWTGADKPAPGDALVEAIFRDSINALLTITHDGIVRSFNPAAERIFLYKAEEVIGQNINILIPAPHHARHDDYIRHFMQVRTSSIIGNIRELHARRKTGEIFPVQLSVSKIDLPGGDLIFSGAIQDISERIEQQKRLAALTKEAQRANQMKSEFLANMSHEIRTPLNGVIGAADLLRKTEISPDQERYLKVISSSGEALLSLINDILDLSKIEAGEMTINPEPLALEDFFQNILQMMAARAGAKGIALSVHFEGELPQAVMADSVRLTQILINLMGNAVKFVEKGYIAVRVEGRGIADGRAALRVGVEDSGIGIPADKLGIIFDKFSQADASTTKKYGGTGLGLAITKRLIEMMGGEIGVKSEVGVGTTFFFDISFPVAQAAPQGARKAEEAGEVSPLGIHVLLVENEMVNQMVATELLEGLGCTVEVAENGQEAVDKIEAAAGAYAVVFMDCMMPVMDGFEATREIRRREKASGRARQLIIAMTANAMAGERDACLQAGMDDYLSKPVTEKSLYSKLREYIPVGSRNS